MRCFDLGNVHFQADAVVQEDPCTSFIVSQAEYLFLCLFVSKIVLINPDS